MDASNAAKTKSLIARLNALVMPRYESYRYRRLPIAMPSGGIPPQQAARVMLAMPLQASFMRMEMPDRWTDIADNPVNIGTGYLTTPIAMPRPAVSQAYLAYYNAHPPSDPTHFAQAKCLYLLVTMGMEDNDVMENFNSSDIKAPDTDGLSCFIDAWGNPIMFLRWAPGFITQPPLPSSRTTLMPPFGGVSNLQTGWDPDQTDPTGVYGAPAAQGAAPSNSNTYALYPLIYSAGADGYYDIITDNSNNGSANPIHHSPNLAARIITFATVAAPTGNGPIGTPYPDVPANTFLSHYDNITNHQASAIAARRRRHVMEKQNSFPSRVVGDRCGTRSAIARRRGAPWLRCPNGASAYSPGLPPLAATLGWIARKPPATPTGLQPCTAEWLQPRWGWGNRIWTALPRVARRWRPTLG